MYPKILSSVDWFQRALWINYTEGLTVGDQLLDKKTVLLLKEDENKKNKQKCYAAGVSYRQSFMLPAKYCCMFLISGCLCMCMCEDFDINILKGNMKLSFVT